MRTFFAWVAPNLARFVIVWAAIGTVAFAAIDFNIHDLVPHSPIKVFFLPVALLLIVLIAAFSTFVALVLGLPVFATWLLVYLPTLWWSERVIRGKARRVVAVALALLPFALLRPEGLLVTVAALVVAVVYGFVVHLPPRLDGSSASGSRSRPRPSVLGVHRL